MSCGRRGTYVIVVCTCPTSEEAERHRPNIRTTGRSGNSQFQAQVSIAGSSKEWFSSHYSLAQQNRESRLAPFLPASAPQEDDTFHHPQAPPVRADLTGLRAPFGDRSRTMKQL